MPNLAEWIIIAGIAVLLALAVFLIILNRKKGGSCHGCSQKGCCDGNCARNP